MSSKTKSRDAHHLSELRIVLLGYKEAGKSSAGNLILNREEFDLKRTAQCVKRERQVADRHITVIEAPGWWINVPVEESPELLKQEILLSGSLCPPGPHTVLLVMRVDVRFTVNDREAFRAYVDLLSERVWIHTIVLFTHGDFLGDTSIEQHIESEGEDLQWLVEKCGNRYHVLNNNNRSDDTQIKDLLEKIEETVMENNGCHFEIHRKIFQEVEEAEEERAEEQMEIMQHNTPQIRSKSGIGIFRKIQPPEPQLRSKSLISPPGMSDDKRSTAAKLSGSSGLFKSDQLGESLAKGSVSSMSSGYGSSSTISESVEYLEYLV